MTSEALTELWECQQRALRHEKEFWRLADQHLAAGIVSIDDIGVIYGCHPHTARKRLAALHYGVNDRLRRETDELEERAPSRRHG